MSNPIDRSERDSDERHWPEWAERRRKSNRVIGVALFALVVLFVGMFVVRYVAR